jgi:hypothetical protein
MSHISKIELEVKDLRTLIQACHRLGLEFREGQRTYKWYGRYMGDYRLPEGFSIDDLGKCDHAIHVLGAGYEVGVVRRGNGYVLLWDFWRSGGLEERIGKGAGFLKQAYAVEKTRAEARRKGYTVTERKTETGIRVHVRMP